MHRIEIVDKIIHALTSGGAGSGGITHALNGFANFGLHEVGHVITQYGGQPHTSPLWEVIAGIYLLSKVGPKYLLLFYIGYRFLKDRLYAVLLSVTLGTLWEFFADYVIHIHPNPFIQFSKVSTGPSRVVTAFTTLLRTHPFQFMTIASTIVVFFVISFLMWYFINFFLYAFTSMFMQTPLFKYSSGKAHAVTFTLMWFFYLGIQNGFHAFISVLFLLATIIMGRIDMGKRVNDYVPNGVRKAARGERLSSDNTDNGQDVDTDDGFWRRR